MYVCFAMLYQMSPIWNSIFCGLVYRALSLSLFILFRTAFSKSQYTQHEADFNGLKNLEMSCEL